MTTSWKAQIQISDLSVSDRIEVECKTCGFFRYEEAVEWQRCSLMQQLYLDELESRLHCHRWGCGGECRIALPSNFETEGFQGGLT